MRFIQFFNLLLQASEEVAKNLLAMKTIMCGTEQHEPQSELVAQLAQEIYKSHIIYLMLKNLSHIDFEVWLSVYLVSTLRRVNVLFC